jgi:hypothetical protein
MPEISIDMENKSISVDFSEAEYRALSWLDEDPFTGIVKRINGKVEYAIEEAVRYEMAERFKDPSINTMPASKEELIMTSMRPSLLEQKTELEALKNGDIEVANER